MAARRRRAASVPDQPGRVVLYVRVSALMGRGGEDFHSPDIQLAGMRSLIGPMGLREVGPPIMDIDVSGQTFVREGLDKVFAMAKAAEMDHVCVNDLSRIGRNLRESLNCIDDLDSLGVRILSARERIDDSTQGRFMLTQFLALAELYGGQVGDAWAATALQRARAGLHAGVPPRGYVRTGRKQLDDGRIRQTGPLQVDPEVGPMVTEAYRRYAAGERAADIVTWWQQQTGQRFDLKALKRLLRNRTYLGRVVLNGQEYTGVHHPLTDPETHDRCARRLNRERHIPPRTLQVVHALAGMIVCDGCSRALVHRRLAANARDPGPFYHHQSALAGATQCRGGGSPRVEHVEAAVLVEVRDRIALLRTDQAARAEHARRVADRTAELPRLERELVAAGEALGRLAGQLARGVVSEDAYKLAAADLEADRTRLAARVDELRDAPVNPGPSAASALLADRLAVLWPAMTPPERQQALRACEVRQVRIVPATRRREPLDGRVIVLFDGDDEPAG